MIIGVCTLELYLPQSESLKDKRSALKGLISRLQREFTVSAAEIDFNDARRSALIGVALVSNSAVHVQQLLANLVRWLEENRPDLDLLQHRVEIMHVTPMTD